MKGKKRLRDGRVKTIDAAEQDGPFPSNTNQKSTKAAKPTSAPQYLFAPQAEWHSATLPVIMLGHAAPKTSQGSQDAPSQDAVQLLYKLGMQLLEEENGRYESPEHEYYKAFMSSGTLSDKISALTLLVRESPLHNMHALGSLIGLAKKRSRSQAVQVLEALKDLFGKGAMLPSDRRLRTFFKQPGLSAIPSKELRVWNNSMPLPSPIEKTHLVAWAYEDWLKSKYHEIIRILAAWCDDEIIFARLNAVNYVFDLLRDRPEQEVNLLHMLVNKLGDPEQKVSSRASQKIIELQNLNPFMKTEIISAIESDVIFRPRQSMHAKYYAVITLNQTILSGKAHEVAEKVLDIYFSLFLSLLKGAQVGRSNDELARLQIYNKNRERQGGGGLTGKKARRRQLEMGLKSTAAENQVRERMLSAILTGINRAVPFKDISDEFFEKNMDTLFKVTHSSNFNTSVQALILIQELCTSNQRPSTSDRFYRTLYESLLDPRLLTTSKHRLFINLLHRAMKGDLDIRRVKAFVKRILQIVPMHQPPFACAILYMLRDIEGIFPSLRSFIDQPEAGDEEETFHDVSDHASSDDLRGIPTNLVVQRYDGRKRDPQYSYAEKSCLWELNLVLPHFHPSVSLFASKLLTHESMSAKPSLEMHTLISFLDRLVYRNPKKSTGDLRGPSIMQPLHTGDISGRHLILTDKTAKLPVNLEAFWKMDEEKIGVDDAFFHKYFNMKTRGVETAKRKKADRKRKGDSVDDEENGSEDEIWKALVDSRPELEGSEEGDDDIDMDDLEDESDVGTAPDRDDTRSTENLDLHGDSDGPYFEEEDALLESDDEVPADFDAQKIGLKRGTKLSRRRKMLKNLPTFASVDEYATMIQNEDELFN